MKYIIILLIAMTAVFMAASLDAQDKAIGPSIIITGEYLGESPPLRDLPALSDAEWQQMVEKAEQEELNPELRTRSYPFAETALPKGPDPVWQQIMGTVGANRAPIMNFQGQTSPYYPPDANGTVGPNHYMQTINTVYAIYNKAGTLVTGPTVLNTLFTGVTGSECNNGDPIVLYDEQADRWLVAEFSLCGATDYMLIAVSTTNDPTGTWHKYSFDVDDMPDYEKFGIWQDGYYMGTNNGTGNDIYVFERSQMLTGGTAQGVGFDNSWRPTTIDGFMCVPPLDNDGAFAPAGEPGLFITLNDDAIGGGSDELWIYELDVDWATPANSTFTLSQQLAVASFDSNFGTDWDNIKQLGTTRELDAIPQVIMNPPQYRNFGTYETILCCHTVDVDNTDHAGIRWYELRRTTGDWSIRQQGTYAPDGHSRWMGSVMLNGDNEIALGYSVSSSTIYPGIRYCGQSSDAYATGASVFDIVEETIQTGAGSQSGANRWGDYSDLSVDPVNDSVFWFTTEYISSTGSRRTKIASFNIPPPPGKWTGTTSANWTTLSNWLDGAVPGSTVNITIPSSAPNWPVFTGDMTLGINCENLTLSGAAQMTVTGNLTISAGKSLTFTGNGEFSIGGNWTRNGTFTPGSGTIKFIGATPATVFASGSTSDITTYLRSTFTKSMTALTGATAGPTGDDGNQDVPIGFTFNYIGTNYTQARISTNGWLSLNLTGGLGYENSSLFDNTIPNATIAPWWDDLIDDVTSVVSYKTEGVVPDRVFTAEWLQVPTYFTGANSRINFQVKLFETTNIIEFHYGSLVAGTHSPSESASIGIEDATGGSGHFIEAITGSTTTGVTNLVSTTNWPTVNYRFSPPLPNEIFQNIIVNKSGTYVDFNTNTTVNSTFNVMPGASFKVKNGKTLTVQGVAVY